MLVVVMRGLVAGRLLAVLDTDAVGATGHGRPMSTPPVRSSSRPFTTEDQPAPGPAGTVPQDWVQRLHR